MGYMGVVSTGSLEGHKYYDDCEYETKEILFCSLMVFVFANIQFLSKNVKRTFTCI